MMKGNPKAFWLSGFFFPHGFMTSILQIYARKHLKAIDFLKFKFNFMTFDQQVPQDSEGQQDLENFDVIDLID